MIRLAITEDAEQLFLLNEQFNGKDETVAEEGDILVGFVCIQIKKSFC